MIDDEIKTHLESIQNNMKDNEIDKFEEYIHKTSCHDDIYHAKVEIKTLRDTYYYVAWNCHNGYYEHNLDILYKNQIAQNISI